MDLKAYCCSASEEFEVIQYPCYQKWKIDSGSLVLSLSFSFRSFTPTSNPYRIQARKVSCSLSGRTGFSDNPHRQSLKGLIEHFKECLSSCWLKIHSALSRSSYLKLSQRLSKSFFVFGYLPWHVERTPSSHLTTTPPSWASDLNQRTFPIYYRDCWQIYLSSYYFLSEVEQIYFGSTVDCSWSFASFHFFELGST